jgi:hypothetical protein
MVNKTQFQTHCSKNPVSHNERFMGQYEWSSSTSVLRKMIRVWFPSCFEPETRKAPSSHRKLDCSKYTLCKWIKTRPYRSFLQSLRRPPPLWKLYFKLTWMISWFGEFFSYIRQKYCMSCHWNDPRNSNLLTLDLDVTLTENPLETCSGYSTAGFTNIPNTC